MNECFKFLNFVIFPIIMCVQKVLFFCKKIYVQNFSYMYKISKENVFTNFQRTKYLQKYVYFFPFKNY